MKPFIFILLVGVTAVLSGCSVLQPIDVYTAGAEPYKPLTDEEVHYSECRINFGDEVSVSGQGAWFSEEEIEISEGGVYIITGSCPNSCINVTTADAVKLIFNNADISNPDGLAVRSVSDRLIIGCDSGASKLTGSGGDYETAIYSRGSVLFVGTGALSLEGGVFSEGGIRFSPAISTFCEICRTERGELISGELSINPQ